MRNEAKVFLGQHKLFVASESVTIGDVADVGSVWVLSPTAACSVVSHEQFVGSGAELYGRRTALEDQRERPRDRLMTGIRRRRAGT